MNYVITMIKRMSITKLLVAYNSTERSKGNGTIKDNLLAWELALDNMLYGENRKHWYSEFIRVHRKFLISISHFYHHEAIFSPALLMSVNGNTQLLRLKALISFSSLPISKASIIPVFPGTLKTYPRYIYLSPFPSQHPQSKLPSSPSYNNFITSLLLCLPPPSIHSPQSSPREFCKMWMRKHNTSAFNSSI